MHASTPSNFGIIFQNDIFELKLCKHDKSMVIAEKALSKNGEDGLAIVLESDESDMSNSRSHVICVGRAIICCLLTPINDSDSDDHWHA